MPPVPVYLIVLTFVLVVIPSVAAIGLRLALYYYLIDRENIVKRLVNSQPPGKKKRIVEEVEKRFADASRNLDQVNTPALIDQIYSQQKVWLFSCEQIEYFCRILPKLLLSFGLLGTFIGITSNLAELSKVINQNKASDVSSLLPQLNQSLQGMSIAFVTSLTGFS